MSEFFFLLTTNRLKVNSRTSHFADVLPSWTFCNVNYVLRQKELGLTGPLIIEKETTMHLFFTCNYVKNSVRGVVDYDWNLQSVL